jgi:hypothetical protein
LDSRAKFDKHSRSAMVQSGHILDAPGVTGVAKKKSAPKKKPAAKATKPAKTSRKPTPVADNSPALAELGFFRGEYDWEADRDVPAFDERLKLRVDHTGDVVAPEQLRALELLLETETPLRPLALRAAYECMLRWVEGYRARHPDFRGKPMNERAFNKGCDFGEVVFPSPSRSEEKPPPRFHISLYWPGDDGHPCEVVFEWQRGSWVIVSCERS